MRPRCRTICGPRRKVHMCHCNSLGGATWCSVMITGRTDRQTDGQTDRQTDRRTDRVQHNMRPPPREEGRIIIIIIKRLLSTCQSHLVTKYRESWNIKIHAKWRSADAKCKNEERYRFQNENTQRNMHLQCVGFVCQLSYHLRHHQVPKAGHLMHHASTSCHCEDTTSPDLLRSYQS